MLLFFTLVFSRYNEIIFLYDNEIIDSLGFAFESNFEEANPDFKINCLDTSTPVTSFEKSTVSSFGRFDEGDYSLFSLDLSVFDCNRLKRSYFVFQGVFSNMILTTPFMKHTENYACDIGISEFEYIDLIVKNEGIGATPIVDNDRHNCFLNLNFSKIGFKEDLFEDCFDQNAYYCGRRSLDSPLMSHYDCIEERIIVSNIIKIHFPFLLSKESERLYNDKEVIIQNQPEKERDEFFKGALSKNEESFRSNFFKILKEKENPNSSSDEKPKSILKKIGDSVLYVLNNTNNNY